MVCLNRDHFFAFFFFLKLCMSCCTFMLVVGVSHDNSITMTLQ